MGHRILVIEDDSAIRRGIVDALGFEGHHTFEAGTGSLGISLARDVECDLILLDLVLPDMDGVDVLKAVRQTQPTLAVIMLTARGDEADRVKGLRAGADDYVVKPFSVKELLARVGAVLRRCPERPIDLPTFEFASGLADFARHELRFRDGSRVEMTERECELLSYLARNPGRAISREEILSHVWKLDPDGLSTRAIDMQVARLREKLRDNEAESLLVTVRGKGYMIR